MADGTGTTATAALLAHGVSLLHDGGPAHPLHHIGARDLAEHAGLAESSVRRIARPIDAFRDLALAHGVHRLPVAQGTMELWAKLRSGAQAPALSAAGHGLQLHAIDTIPISRVTAWANAHRSLVAEQVVHAVQVFRGFLAAELDARWREAGMAPVAAAPDQPTAYGLVLAAGLGGPLALHPRSDDARPAERRAARLLANTCLAISEPGEWSPDLPDMPNPVVEAPFVDQSQVPLIDAVLSIVHDTGPAAPADHLTIRSVSDAAGVSAGSIYGVWDDMAHYRRSVVSEHLRQAREHLERTLSAEPSSVEMAAAVAAGVDGAVHRTLLAAIAAGEAGYLELATTHLDEMEALLADPLGSLDDAHDAVSFALGAATLSGIDPAFLSDTGQVTTAHAVHTFLQLQQSSRWGAG